jgi:hypothetical protein
MYEKKGATVLNKYGPTGQHEVTEVYRESDSDAAHRLKIGAVGLLFSWRPDALWDGTSLVRPDTGNASPDNRVIRSDSP